MCISLFKIWNLYKLYKLYNDINHIHDMEIENITDEYCNSIKERIFNGGCIYIKFAQWLISKMKTDANHNPTIAKFTNYFEDIFEQCPYHPIDYSIKKLNEDLDIDLFELVKKDTLKIIASGSVGQVYYAELCAPMFIYKNEYYAYKENILMLPDYDESELQEIKKIAIKVKHPNVNDDVIDKCKLFELLAWFQTKPFLKRNLGLHLDFMEFIDNINQQIDFRNEKKNCDRFIKNFAGEKLVKFPKVIIATRDIVISEFIECEELENIPEFSQMKTCINFSVIISKMMLVDNFTHLDLHHKNWKIRKINDIDYQIVIFDFGIVYTSPSMDLNRKIWDTFEIKDTDMILEIFPQLVVGELNDEMKTAASDIVNYYATNTLDLNIMLNRFNTMLSEHNSKLSAFTLNLALTLTLIENILKKHNIVNTQKPKLSHTLTVRQKQLDTLAYCKSKNAYPDFVEYLENKIKRNDKLNDHSRKSIFSNNSTLELDLPE